MSDTTKLAPCWRLAVTVTEAGALQNQAMPYGFRWREKGQWTSCDELRLAGVAWASYVEALTAFNPDGTTGPLVTRATVTRREWTEAPPNDETEIVTLHGDMTPTTEWGQNCQTPWVKTIREGKHEIAWTTPEEFAALLGGQREVTEAMVIDAMYTDGVDVVDAGRYAAHINAALRAAP